MPKRCTMCGTATTSGPRCRICERVYQYNRNQQPTRQAYADPMYRSISVQGKRCHICGGLGADTRDHVIPLAQGGTNDPSNVKPAHRSCNSGKRYESSAR